MKNYRCVRSKLLSPILTVALILNQLPLQAFAAPASQHPPAFQKQWRPEVTITSPKNNAVISFDKLDVSVYFKSHVWFKFGKWQIGGNVRLILLKLDGKIVASAWNPARVKKGIKTFSIDTKNISEGKHLLQAFAYQGMFIPCLEGRSAPVTFIMRRVLPNHPPIANAGINQKVNHNTKVLLDASASNDPDGDALTYKWNLTSQPQASTAILINTNTVNPEFTADKPGNYIIKLIVNDGKVDSLPADVTINALNRPPLVNAGPDKSIHAGNNITLEASVSDPDGDTLISYQWMIISSPEGSTASLSSNSLTPEFRADRAGVYELQFKVNDEYGTESIDNVSITLTNQLPLASAIADNENVLINTRIFLDASSSSDPDSDSLTYHWTLHAPQNSQVVLVGGDSVAVHFTPDLAGSYEAELTVNDPWGGSATASVFINAQRPSDPVVTPQSGFIHGKILDSATELPLADVMVTATNVTGSLPTDNNGTFSFPTVGSGEYTLTFAKDGYISSERTARVVTTRDASVGVVYMKQLDPMVTTITNAGGTHSNSAGTLEFTFPANALPVGVDSIDVRATLYEKDRELLSPLPRSTIFTYAFKVLPDRVTFNQPVSGRLANSLGFAPGTAIPIGYYNPDTHKWEDTGNKGIVSADGIWLDFQITHFCGYDCNFPPQPPPQDRAPTVNNQIKSNDDKSKNCAKAGTSLVYLKSGELVQEYALPACRLLNQDFSLKFTYNSRCASPASLLCVETTNLDPSITNIPPTTSLKFSIEGRTGETYYNGTSEKTQISYLFDNTNARGESLPTGSYPYTLEVANNYTNVTYGTADFFGGPATGNTGVLTRESVPLINTIKGRISVNNQQNSAFGSGWSLSGLQKLSLDADGAISISEGDGSVKTFRKKTASVVSLAAAWASYAIGIYRGNGDGTFNYDWPVDAHGVGGFPFDHITAADVNGDLNTDLIMNVYDGGGAGTWSIAVFLGNGDGTFQSVVNYPLSGVDAVAVGDFDGDGCLDIVASQPWVGISVLFGNGDGTFQLPQTVLDQRIYITQLSAADINNDGNTDIVFGVGIGSNETFIYVLSGKGDGTFHSVKSYAVSNNSVYPRGFIIDDFNRDGRNDLIVAMSNWNGSNPSNYISVFIGNVDSELGELRDSVNYPVVADNRSIATGDFNHDSYLDLITVGVVPNGTSNLSIISILFGNGDGTFRPQVTYPSYLSNMSYVESVTADDFNHDDIDDIAVGGAGINILLGNGDGTFQSPINYGIPRDTDLARLTAFTFDAVPDFPKGAFLPSAGDSSYIIYNLDTQSYTRFLKDGTKINFNQQGLQTSAVDKNGNALTYTYDDTNGDGKAEELDTITLPTGQQYQFAYSGGKLFSITDPAGRATQFDIDSQGDLKQTINADNTGRSFDYDSRHLMTRKTDERGFITDYDYDDYGMIRQTRSPEREVSDVDANGSVSTRRLRETRNYIPSNSKKLINDLPIGSGTELNPADPACPEEIIETFIDGKSNTWIYKTNKFGGRLQFKDPLNNTTNYERDGNSNLRKLIRANGSTQRLIYSNKENLISMTENHNNAKIKIKYDLKFNQPTDIEDALNNKTHINYDTQGNPVSIIDAKGAESKLEYNSRGQVIKIIAAFGAPEQAETRFEYDPVTFNLVKTINPLNQETAYSYDQAGNITQVKDANNKITGFTYDSMNRLKTAIDADNKITGYAYDSAGNLLSVTDPNTHTTAFSYDEQGQLIKTVNPLNQQKLFSYDTNRNLSLIVTPNNDTIKFYYNEANILKKKFLPADTVSCSYDNMYNPVTVSDSDSSLSFNYDPIGRLIEAKTNAGFVQPQTTLQYAYDLNNNLINMIDPSSIITKYAYDALNRLTEIKDSVGQSIVHYDYDVLSRRTGKTLFTAPTIQQTANYTYDKASRLLSLNNLLSGMNYAYNYDDVGNRISLTDTYGAHNYAYDNLYRLASSANPIENYSYDPVGNRNPLTYNYGTGSRFSC